MSSKVTKDPSVDGTIKDNRTRLCDRISVADDTKFVVFAWNTLPPGKYREMNFIELKIFQSKHITWATTHTRPWEGI